MAGGTGGHVFPALSAARALQEQGVRTEWLGTERGIEARLVPEAGITLHCLSMAGLRGKGLLARLKGFAQAGFAVFSCIALINRLKPSCVIGLGGYASGPGGLAAFILRKPLLIHEQNAVAGTTNRLLAKVATRVLTGYPITLGGQKNSFIGNPVRSEICALPAPANRWQGRDGAIRVLVLGGSLGAKPINDLLLAAAPELGPSIALWHQAGVAHAEALQASYQVAGVAAKVEPFIADMAEAYAWADLVICRAGALTCAELAAAGVGSLLIPLPHAIDDHQTANAKWLADNNAGEILVQAEISATKLVAEIQKLLDRDVLLDWAENARSIAKVDAAKQLAKHCMGVMA
jgi:UDP-N-acetylglucosamine--N-acetylmuramyl-(pentapeptide) pyrophosphoryl-undecaprenol N-acetylglucosamine transferase